MKQTGAKNKQVQELKRRLELVRSTVRVLTPTELEHVNAGDDTKVKNEAGTNTGCQFLTI